MQIYQKVCRYLNATSDTKRFSLWKEKCRLVRQGFARMDIDGYTYGVLPLTIDLLSDFIPVYTAYINSKENASVADLSDIYKSRIESGESIYFWYVRSPEGTLLAGGIFVHKVLLGKDTLTLWFRANVSTFVYNKLQLWYYIESMFFDFGEQLGIEQFSRGKDRNGYGLFWANIGLCMHKLQLHFLPFIVDNSILIDVDISTIFQDCVFFVDPNIDNQFTRVVLYTLDSDSHSHFISLAEKRWLTVEIVSY